MTTEKLHIIDSLGERSLVLPALVNAALMANDRAKYYFTLLQTAAYHAEHPEHVAADLRRERLSCGVTDEKFDTVVAGSAGVGDGRYRIPNAAEIVHDLMDEVEVMLRPLRDGPADFGQRFAELKSSAPAADDDVLTAADIDLLAAGSRDRTDSLHMLVMDVHKALNALQREIASEELDGASVYRIDGADRPLIRAFMRGVRRTAPLKFDHPGLGTTATRADGRLVLQNDIGTTDAHVLVVHVEGRLVTVTYTDVHLQRLLFFQECFSTTPLNGRTRSRAATTRSKMACTT